MMGVGKTLVQLVILVVTLTGRTSAKGQKCRREKHEYYHEHLGCNVCESCPAGMQPNYEQEIKIDPTYGALSCPVCQTCPQGQYHGSRDYELCQTCYSCAALSRHTELPCTLTSNAVCGRCLPGYHDVYKSRYDLETPVSTKPCQRCDKAPKDAPECQNLTRPTSAVTPKTGSSKPNGLLLDNGTKQRITTQAEVNKDIEPELHQLTVTEHSLQTYLIVASLSVLLLVAVVILLIYVLNTYRKYYAGHNTVSFTETDGMEKGIDKETANTSLSGSTIPPDRRKLLPPDVEPDGDAQPGSTESVAMNRLTVVTPEDIRVIQRHIGRQWRDLARGLQIFDSDIEALGMDYLDTSERIYQLILLWKRTYPGSYHVPKLCSTLQSLGRNDLALIINKNH